MPEPCPEICVWSANNPTCDPPTVMYLDLIPLTSTYKQSSPEFQWSSDGSWSPVGLMYQGHENMSKMHEKHGFVAFTLVLPKVGVLCAAQLQAPFMPYQTCSIRPSRHIRRYTRTCRRTRTPPIHSDSHPLHKDTPAGRLPTLLVSVCQAVPNGLLSASRTRCGKANPNLRTSLSMHVQSSPMILWKLRNTQRATKPPKNSLPRVNIIYKFVIYKKICPSQVGCTNGQLFILVVLNWLTNNHTHALRFPSSCANKKGE